MDKNLYVAIMAGGIGSRFWPKSRTKHPKQFLDVLNKGKTLIQSTFERYTSFVPIENIYVVTSSEYVDLVKKQLPKLPSKNILGEPYRKNTAPCIAYISFKIKKKNPKACIIAAPADHLIEDEETYKKTVEHAVEFSNQHNAFVTLGIKPQYPNTGFGYIQMGEKEVAPNIFKVKTFTEKPNLEMAKTFVESGEFLWNAGIFVFRAERMIAAFEKYLPEIYEVFHSQIATFNTLKEKRALEKIYPLCTTISIDNGIMEKSREVYVIPSLFSWSDLGTWNSVWENKQKDYFQNVANGDKIIVFDAANNIINAPNNKVVVVEGLENFIVVDTPDALLICRRDKEQNIKDYISEVKRNMGDKFL